MPTYKYRATDDQGIISRGIIDSSTPQDLYNILNNQHLHLISYRHALAHRQLPFMRQRRQLTTELSDLCVHVTHLDQAGIPLLDIIADLITLATHTSLKQALIMIQQQVKEGHRLSQSLENFPHIFDSLFVQMVRCSEQTGHLHQGFSQINHYLNWQKTTRENLTKALRYPCLVGVMIVITFIIMSKFLIPQIQDLLSSLNTTLPQSTKILLSFSQIWSTAFLPLCFAIPGIAIMIFGVRHLSDKWHSKIDHGLLKIPLIGKCYQQICLTYFFHNFTACIAAGLDLLASLDLSGQGLTNSFLAMKIDTIKQGIHNGQCLSQAFKASNIFCPTTYRMLRAGEDSGTLPTVLPHIRDHYESQSRRKVETLVSVIEPTLLSITGLMLLWIIVAVFYPLYSSLNTWEM